MVMLVVNNLWFSGVLFFFLAGTKTMAGLIRDSSLPFSPPLYIYFLGLCSVSFLL